MRQTSCAVHTSGSIGSRKCTCTGSLCKIALHESQHARGRWIRPRPPTLCGKTALVTDAKLKFDPVTPLLCPAGERSGVWLFCSLIGLDT
jgi:hypothetical protein